MALRILILLLDTGTLSPVAASLAASEQLAYDTTSFICTFHSLCMEMPNNPLEFHEHECCISFFFCTSSNFHHQFSRDGGQKSKTEEHHVLYFGKTILTVPYLFKSKASVKSRIFIRTNERTRIQPSPPYSSLARKYKTIDNLQENLRRSNLL